MDAGPNAACARTSVEQQASSEYMEHSSSAAWRAAGGMRERREAAVRAAAGLARGMGRSRGTPRAPERAASRFATWGTHFRRGGDLPSLRPAAGAVSNRCQTGCGRRRIGAWPTPFERSISPRAQVANRASAAYAATGARLIARGKSWARKFPPLPRCPSPPAPVSPPTSPCPADPRPSAPCAEQGPASRHPLLGSGVSCESAASTLPRLVPMGGGGQRGDARVSRPA